MRAVDRRVAHVQQPDRPQLGQRHLVQARPDTGLGPVPKPPPGRHPTATDPLSRDIPPAHALAQHVNDPAQSRAVIRRQPTGIPPAPRRTWKEQWSNAFPQVIRHKINRHPDNSAARTLNSQALHENSL